MVNICGGHIAYLASRAAHTQYFSGIKERCLTFFGGLSKWKRSINCVKPTVHRNPTHIGLYLNFHSSHFYSTNNGTIEIITDVTMSIYNTEVRNIKLENGPTKT